MRLLRVCVVVSLSLVLAMAVFAQTSTTQTSPQALTLLRNSLVVLTGGQSMTDVTLTGTARRVVGPSDESGTATYKAISGANRLDLNLSDGAHSEVANQTSSTPAGSWSGPDNVSHPMALQNVSNKASVSPAFTLAALISAQNLVATFVGQETKAGHTVNHLCGFQQFPQMAAKTAAVERRLTQIDIFLDVSTSLPVALDFSTHPDNDAGLDIPVELLFSDYRPVNGAQISFHVQKFLNNSLLLDLQFTSAQLNSGLSASAFNVQ